MRRTSRPLGKRGCSTIVLTFFAWRTKDIYNVAVIGPVNAPVAAATTQGGQHVIARQGRRRDVVERPPRAARRVRRLAFPRTLPGADEHSRLPAWIALEQHDGCR